MNWSEIVIRGQQDIPKFLFISEQCTQIHCKHHPIIIIIPTVVSGWVDFVCQLSQHTNGTTKCHQKSYYRTFGNDLDYAQYNIYLFVKDW